MKNFLAKHARTLCLRQELGVELGGRTLRLFPEEHVINILMAMAVVTQNSLPHTQPGWRAREGTLI